MRQPGPIRAFYRRVKGRRGHQVAIVAASRKLACLFWCLLTRGEDYAYGQPSLTRKKLRLLELRAGAPSRKGIRTGKYVAGKAMREAERAAAEQAEAAYKRTVADWQATQAKERAPARHRGAHLVARQAGKQRDRTKPLALRFSSSSGPAPAVNSPKDEEVSPGST